MQNLIKSLKFFVDKNIITIDEIATHFDGNHLAWVKTDEGNFSVRRMNRGEGNPSSEYEISNIAANIGIAPQIYCFDPENLTMVSQWIEGEHKSVLKTDDLIKLVEALQAFHSVDTSDLTLPRINLRSIVNIDDEGIEEAFGILERYPAQNALCHNDPNPENIIWRDNSARLIDFEYAGVNDIYFDLAAVSVEFSLSEVADRVLLDEYCREEGWRLDKFQASKVIYAALSRQWIEDHTP